MKVIHSCTSLSFSGLEKYVLELAHWQRQQGLNVELFCRAGSELQKEALKKNIPAWEISHDVKKGPAAWLQMRKAWKKRLSSGERIVLHMHAGGEPWFHLPWLLSGKISKSILQYHLWINHRKKDPVHSLLFRGVNEVWCSSTAAESHLKTLLPHAGQWQVIPYGRDVVAMLKQKEENGVARNRIRTALSVSDNALVGLCISRIEPIKGIGELFDAFEMVYQECPNLVLLVAGDVSPQNEEARLFAEKIFARHAAAPAEFRKRFHFLGYRADALDLMLASDFYVLPSYEECMSLAMLDASVLGLPILGTNSGGTPSVARPGETGWLAEPRSVASLAEALRSAQTLFVSAPERWVRMKALAQRLAELVEKKGVFQRIWALYEK